MTQIKGAVMRGDKAAVERLCEKKPRLTEARNTLGRTPVMQASADGHLEIVRFLIEERGADVMARSFKTDSESMAIHLAADNGHVDVVAYFVDKWPASEMMEARDKDGDTVLARAAYSGQVEVVEFLIRRGANLEARGYRGRTPIMRAAARGHADVVETLIGNGADFRAKSSCEDFEKTAIHLAAAFGHKDVIAMFLEKDANLAKTTNMHGDTAMCYAALGGHVEVIKFLLENGFGNIETRGRRGRTPLMQAASYGHVEAANFLIERGAKIDARSSAEDGEQTATELAGKYGYQDVADAITKHQQ